MERTDLTEVLGNILDNAVRYASSSILISSSRRTHRGGQVTKVHFMSLSCERSANSGCEH
jgi:signal transduction histidine kinase